MENYVGFNMIDIELCPTLLLNSTVATVLSVTTLSFICNQKKLISLIIPALLALICFSVSWLLNLIYIMFIAELLFLHFSLIFILLGVICIFYIIINFIRTFPLIKGYMRTTPPKIPYAPDHRLESVMRLH